MRKSIDELRSLHDTIVRNEHIGAFYDKLPRNLWWDKGNRECSTTIIREAVDTQELIHRMQSTDLFSINTNTDIKKAAIEWLVRKYESCGIGIDSLPSAVQESPHSRPDISINRNGRLLSIDFLRTLSVSSDIQRYIQKSNPPLTVIELGAGLGHLARTMRLFGISKTHVILDLPETLIFSFAFLTENFPDASVVFITDPRQAAEIRLGNYDFVFAPSCFAEAIDFTGAELFVNTASLGEMNNETIRYWMDFVQHRIPVKYLFTQNRFLNTIDPAVHPWRWDENECSVHYDSSWTILKWELEPPWFQCPYIVPLAARHLEIAATREDPQDPKASANRGARLLEEVKQEDWFRTPDEPGHMRMHQNRFVTDVTMTGALFKLWESIRLRPAAEAVFVLLRYLETLLHRETAVFEESRYYERLFLKLVETDETPDFVSCATALRARHNSHPVSARIEIVAETADYNIVQANVIAWTVSGKSSSTRYYAIAKAMGPVDLFRERLGERELAHHILIGDTLETAIQKAEKHGRPAVHLVGSTDGYNLIQTQSGYFAVDQLLGPINLFQERIGDRELAPAILKASTYEEIRERIKKTREQERTVP